jgi:hypothetical protein
MITPTGVLLALAVVALIIAWTCIRRPHAGLIIMMLVFIPAPLYPMDEFGWVFYGFAGFLLIILMAWLLQVWSRVKPFVRASKHDGIASSLKLWLLLCGLGLPLSLIFNHGSFADRLYFFAKGTLPFVYLLVFFVVRALTFTERQVRQLLNCLLAVAMAFALISFAIYAVMQVRVTWIYAPLAFPFAVLGANVTFARMLRTQRRTAAIGWAMLTAVLAIAVMVTFTKAQMIAMVLSLMLIAVLIGKGSAGKTTLRAAVFAVTAALLAACALALVPNEARTSFSDLLASRFADSGTTESRVTESELALSEFAQSPVIGKGIGYQLERIDLGESISSNYVHNEITYVGMTMGIAGLIVYSMLLGNWCGLIRRVWKANADVAWSVAALHGCVLTLMVYALMFATFRTIQHNCLLGIFLGLMVNFYPQLSGHTAQRSSVLDCRWGAGPQFEA